jgi:hypothetical protein
MISVVVEHLIAVVILKRKR